MPRRERLRRHRRRNGRCQRLCLRPGPLADAHFRHLVRQFHRLGPRPLAEFLAELGAERLLRSEIEVRLTDFVIRLDRERLAAVAGAAKPGQGGGSMSNIVASGEAFTLWVNGDGRAVEKPLGAMSAAEVALALAWAQAEERRLERIAAPWVPIAEDLERGIEPDIGRDEARAGVEALRAAGEATLKLARLLAALHAAMPRWSGSPLAFKTALRRYWPRR